MSGDPAPRGYATSSVLHVTNTKSSVLVGIVVLVAFVFGYKRESIELALNEWVAEEPEVEEVAETLSAPAAPPPHSPPVQPAPAPSNNPFGEAYRNMALGRPPGAPPTAAPTPPPPSPFGGNIETIQQGKIDETQKAQRNLYFERLSEQMKALRQSETLPDQARPKIASPEAPPPAANSPSSPAAPGPRTFTSPDLGPAPVPVIDEEMEHEPLDLEAEADAAEEEAEMAQLERELEAIENEPEE